MEETHQTKYVSAEQASGCSSRSRFLQMSAASREWILAGVLLDFAFWVFGMRRRACGGVLSQFRKRKDLLASPDENEMVTFKKFRHCKNSSKWKSLRHETPRLRELQALAGRHIMREGFQVWLIAHELNQDDGRLLFSKPALQQSAT